MNILAFESSCDETAVAVVRDGRTVLSDAILSQADMHALYGGVVPEIASRKHVEAISGLTDQALCDAGPGAYRGGAGGSELCQECGLQLGGAADPGASHPGAHRRQLPGISGLGAAIFGTGHLRGQHPYRGCEGLYGHGNSRGHPGRRRRGVL